MNFLKSRWTAAAVLAAVVLIFTPLGAKRSLEKAVADAEDAFYTGAYIEDGDYTAGSIDSYLESRINAALGLVTVGRNYPALSEATDALADARTELLEAESITDKYLANEALEAAWTELYSELSVAGADETDISNADEYAALLEGAQGAINMSGYNESVDRFNEEVLDRFPAELIASVFSIEPPESFGEN